MFQTFDCVPQRPRLEEASSKRAKKDVAAVAPAADGAA